MKHTKIFFENDFSVEETLQELVPLIPQDGIPLTLSVNQATGTFSVHDAQGKVGMDHISGALTLDGTVTPLSQWTLSPITSKTTADGTQYCIHWQAPNHAVTWTWTILARQADVLLIASLHNTGTAPVSISDWILFDAKSENNKSLFAPIDHKTRFFRWNSWDMGVLELADENSSCYSSNLLHLYDPAAQKNMLISFLTLSRTKAVHNLTTTKGEGISAYDGGLYFGNYLLQPNMTFNSELCFIGFYDNPNTALESWAGKVRDIYQPNLNELPPVGWNGGSWASHSAAKGLPWEEYLLSNGKIIREKLKGFDVDYLWTSQSNLVDYIPGNWMETNPNEIPSGLVQYFEKQKAMGYKSGLWVSPFWFYGEAQNTLEQCQDFLLRDENGDPICVNEVWGWRYEDDDQPWYHMHRYFLDGSHPKTIEYVKNMFSYLNKIGVRYYMLDFLDIMENSVLHDQTRTPHQAGYSILREIRSASGEETHLQTAVASSPGFTGTISAARVGRDFGEGRPLDTSLCDWRTATNVLHDRHYSNTLYFLKNIAGSYFTHQSIYINDFNIMTIDKPYPEDYVKIVTTLFGLGGGSPLMLGDNMATLDDDRLKYIKMCLPRTHHSAKPADLFERVQPQDYSRLMTLTIDKPWGSYLLAGAFNMDDRPYELTLDFAKLGLDPAKKYVVYDFWNTEYCGIFRDHYPVVIPSDSCKLYRIEEAHPHPWILSTDMHIQQGCTELLNLCWNPETMTLSGTLTRPAGEKGNLFLLIPRNYKLLNHMGINLMKELLDFNIVAKVPISFDLDTASFSFTFEEWNFNMLAPRGHIPYATKEEWQAYMAENYKKQTTRVFE